MAITELKNTQRAVSYSIDADGTVGPIGMGEFLEASYQLARRNSADGSVDVEVTNDPDRNDWFTLSSHTAEALNQLTETVEAIRFNLSGNTTGTHYIHIHRLPR